MNPQEMDKLFAIASLREMEAHEFYKAASAKIADPNVRDIFAQLARDEMGHYELIARFRSDPTTVMKIAPPQGDWKVAESEKLPTLSTDMKPRDAVALAMKKEQQAVEFYRSLSAATSDAQMKSAFDSFANMELGHKRKLETMFVDIGYPEVF